MTKTAREPRLAKHPDSVNASQDTTTPPRHHARHLPQTLSRPEANYCISTTPTTTTTTTAAAATPIPVILQRQNV
ncbi:hypothetical protein E2C01_060079 [Portunus trituberculatus]|uniref:Uncharacterized protein n=1 Tax=Portunus trituberculatus TaxID=210409 RepID=A0A5B7H020_PORTR|nr:hypothetical protein [Portunus trituberculatus]